MKKLSLIRILNESDDFNKQKQALIDKLRAQRVAYEADKKKREEESLQQRQNNPPSPPPEKQSLNGEKPDENMYTNIASFIRQDKEIWNYFKSRYGPYTAGQLDSIDASYSWHLGKGMKVSPEQFFDWYIKNEIDLRDAKLEANDPQEEPHIRKIMQGLIQQIEKANKG